MTFISFWKCFYFEYLVGELKDNASEKVDEVKDKASELATDAKAVGEGKYACYQREIVWLMLFYMNRSQTTCPRERYD
jgi:hypothetical protein